MSNETVALDEALEYLNEGLFTGVFAKKDPERERIYAKVKNNVSKYMHSKGLKCEVFTEGYIWGTSRYQFLKGKVSQFIISCEVTNSEAQKFINAKIAANTAYAGGTALYHVADNNDDDKLSTIGSVAGGAMQAAGAMASAAAGMRAMELHKELAHEIIQSIINDEEGFTKAVNTGLGSWRISLESIDINKVTSTADRCIFNILCYAERTK